MRTQFAILVAGITMASLAGADGSAQSPTVPAAQQYPHRLTAAELRATIPNSTAYSPGKFGPKSLSIYRSPDGHIHMKSPEFEDFGIYRITDDGFYCTKYQKVRDGVETCQAIWQVGADAFESHLPNGQVIKSIAPVPGNPDRL